MSYSCFVYGLGLHFNRPIPALALLPPADRIDVEITLGTMPEELESPVPANSANRYLSEETEDCGTPTLQVSSLFGGRYLRSEYSDGTIIVVDGQGTRVWATWPDSATIDDTATYLLGPTLGLVLRLRGITCMHASAIVIGDRAIALAGPSGAGKSSAAAAFAKLGYAILADDIVALSEREDGFWIQPGYPSVRLWPESVAGLFGSPDALPLITPSWSKRFLDLAAPEFRFQAQPLPLAAVYLLDERCAAVADPVVAEIHPRSALMRIVSDTYATRLLDPVRRAMEFEVLGRMAGAVPMRLVQAGADFLRIADLCRAVVDDFHQFRSKASILPLENH